MSFGWDVLIFFFKKRRERGIGIGKREKVRVWEGEAGEGERERLGGELELSKGGKTEGKVRDGFGRWEEKERGKG